ncbi:hypothetical protein T06_7399 [Trichinella sp. T6]|nr:hypothetical protein T06_7399 [Trichinella sp. T6]
MREVQAGTFPIDRIEAGSTELPKRNPIASLCRFVDMEGLLRVGGRLTNAGLLWCHKHRCCFPATERSRRSSCDELTSPSCTRVGTRL